MAIRKKKRPAIKKKAVKKLRVKRKIIPKKPARRLKKKENIIGIVTHYFPKVRAAVVKLKAPLAIGDTVKIKGHTTDFKQNVSSMQLEHVPVNSAKKGREIGLFVDSRVRQHDVVYKL